jgi:GNAT superfamily N-acetyltransferase
MWWDGRDLTHMIMKLFFYHFRDTIFIAEKENEIVGFLVGFLSQSAVNEGYIHFAGIHPNYRKTGLGYALFHKFFDECTKHGRNVVRSCTSPINKQSIAFHQHMGYEIEPGDSEIDGLPVTINYHRKNDPKVIFKKTLNTSNENLQE